MWKTILYTIKTVTFYDFYGHLRQPKQWHLGSEFAKALSNLSVKKFYHFLGIKCLIYMWFLKDVARTKTSHHRRIWTDRTITYPAEDILLRHHCRWLQGGCSEHHVSVQAIFYGQWCLSSDVKKCILPHIWSMDSLNESPRSLIGGVFTSNTNTAAIGWYKNVVCHPHCIVHA